MKKIDKKQAFYKYVVPCRAAPHRTASHDVTVSPKSVTVQCCRSFFAVSGLKFFYP
jgi:hypothetical protein